MLNSCWKCTALKVQKTIIALAYDTYFFLITRKDSVIYLTLLIIIFFNNNWIESWTRFIFSLWFQLQELFETYSASKTILFLDLKWEEQIQTRIHIEMSADSSSLQIKFADRCVLGREGALFRKTDLSSFLLSSYKTNLLSMKSPTCQFAERPSSTLLCEVEEGLYALWVEGLVFRSIVGNVTRGSSVLRTIIAKNTINDVFIEESGMILEQ